MSHPLPHINQVAISGRLRDNIVFRVTENGHATSHFTIAVKRQYRDTEDRWQTETLVVPIISQGKIARHYQPGQPVFITGRLTLDPQEHIVLLVRCIQFLDGGND